MRSRAGLFVIAITLVTHGAVGAMEPPVAVSPGSAVGVAQVELRCPTFNWGGVAGAQSYELEVYLVTNGDEEAKLVLRQTVFGKANGWTPSLDSCLERGGQYAWSLRAVGREESSDWSPPILFQVVSGLSEVEFENVLEVMRQYLVTRGETETEGVTAASVEVEPHPSWEASVSSAAPAEGVPTLLTVEGNIDATSFSGDGSALTNVAPESLATITISASGSGQICVTCPVPHPFMMGGACEKAGGGLMGFGPDTTIDTTTYCCQDVAAGNNVDVTAVCAIVQ